MAVGDDPEQWLELVDDQVFDRWEAYYRLEPFGGEQHLLAQIAAMLWVICSKEFEDRDKMTACIENITATFMPPNWAGQRDDANAESNQYQQLETLRDKMARVFG